MIKMTLSQPEIKMKIAPAKVVYTGDSKPYEGVYDVTPKTYEPVVLPTRNRLLSRDWQTSTETKSLWGRR